MGTAICRGSMAERRGEAALYPCVPAAPIDAFDGWPVACWGLSKRSTRRTAGRGLLPGCWPSTCPPRACAATFARWAHCWGWVQSELAKRRVRRGLLGCGRCARECRMGTVAPARLCHDSGVLQCLDCAADCPKLAIAFGGQVGAAPRQSYDPRAAGAGRAGRQPGRRGPASDRAAQQNRSARLRPPGAREIRCWRCLRCGACTALPHPRLRRPSPWPAHRPVDPCGAGIALALHWHRLRRRPAPRRHPRLTREGKRQTPIARPISIRSVHRLEWRGDCSSARRCAGAA